MMKKRCYKVIFVSLLLLLVAPLVFATGLNLENAFQRTTSVPFGSVVMWSGYQRDATPEYIIARVINIVLSIFGLLFMILIIYGGCTWMTARGEEQRATKAKETITAAVIGLIIVVAAYAISYFVVENLLIPAHKTMPQEPSCTPGQTDCR